MSLSKNQFLLLKLRRKNKKLSKSERKLVNHEPYFPNILNPNKISLKSVPSQSSKKSLISATGIQQLITLTTPPILPSAILSFDNQMELMRIVYFKNLCPSVISKFGKCTPNCMKLHSPPSRRHFEKQLLKGTKEDSRNVYEFVAKFPKNLREKFLPIMSKVFVKQQQMTMLKRVIKDCQHMQLDNRFVAEEMVRMGWSLLDAAKWIINACE